MKTTQSFTESDEKVEADEYVISYDGIIYDDEVKVGYMSFLCRRTDGQPLTQIEKNRIKRGDFARKDFEGRAVGKGGTDCCIGSVKGL